MKLKYISLFLRVFIAVILLGVATAPFWAPDPKGDDPGRTSPE